MIRIIDVVSQFSIWKAAEGMTRMKAIEMAAKPIHQHSTALGATSSEAYQRIEAQPAEHKKLARNGNSSNSQAKRPSSIKKLGHAPWQLILCTWPHCRLHQIVFDEIPFKGEGRTTSTLGIARLVAHVTFSLNTVLPVMKELNEYNLSEVVDMVSLYAGLLTIDRKKPMGSTSSTI